MAVLVLGQEVQNLQGRGDNMKKILLIYFILSLTSIFFAEDKTTLSGEFQGSQVSTDVSGNEAKFNEYRDLENGLYGKIKLKYDREKYFLKFNAYDMGYGTQSYEIEGGGLTSFKMYFKYNEIPHNFTYDARTIFSGAGTNKLSASSYFILNNPETYTPSNVFDYSLQRKNGEAGFTLDLIKPFYFNVSFSRETRDGIKPTAAPLTMGGGSYFIEMPEPINYVTNNFKAEWGYAKKTLFFSFSYLRSEFSNENQYLYFTNVYNATMFNAPELDYLTLPPDNKNDNLSFKGTIKLPLKSTVNVKFSKTRASSSYNLLDYYIRNVTGGIQNVDLSDLKFDGKFSATNYDVTITSYPSKFISTKVFYNGYEKNNESDEITQTDPNVNGGNPFTTHLFDYNKKKSGVEFDLKFVPNFSIISSYTNLKIERHRGDLPETKDNIYLLELKWDGLDFLIGKVGYERLERSAVHLIPETLFETDQALANVVEKYLFRFDGAPMDRDSLKASLEIYPLDFLSFNLYFKDKKSDYKETILGLKEDKRQEVGVDFDLNIGNFATFVGYGSYEKTKLPQFQRFSLPQGSLDPYVPGDSNSYNWEVLSENKTYNYGAIAEIKFLNEKLLFNLNYDYMKSDGLFDFTFFDYTPAQNSDISNVDDWWKKTFSLKLTYNFDKNFSFFGCYFYEKYSYSDIALDGYLYTYNGGSDTSITSLTGAYMEPSYKTNLAFLGVTYKF